MSDTTIKYFVKGMSTAAVVMYSCFGSPTIDYVPSTNEPVAACCLPEDFFENQHYRTYSIDRPLEDEFRFNNSLGSPKTIYEDLQRMLLSEELEKARELLQNAVKIFPNEESLKIAKRILLHLQNLLVRKKIGDRGHP